MSAPVFYDGAAELATLTNTFKVGTTPTDPTTVTLVVTTPSGVSTTYTYSATITKTSAGVFTKDVPCTEPGEWYGVWVGTGAASDVQPVRWTVFDTDSVLYASPENVKSRLRIRDTDDDFEVIEACEAVTEWIDLKCEDFFGRSSRTQTFEADCGGELEIPSLVSLTTLATDDNADGTYETAWTVNVDFQLLPYNTSNGRIVKPYTKIKTLGVRSFPLAGSFRANLVQIAGVWGWPTTPAGVRNAALNLATDTFKLRDAPFGVAGFDTFGVVRVKADGPAMKHLGPFLRHPVVIA